MSDFTIQGMKTIIAGMLPPPSVAAELANYVEKHCPALVEIFKRAAAQSTALDSRELGCTTLEWIKLQLAGFEQLSEHNFGANMALVLSGAREPQQPVYLGELSCVNVGRERLTMVHPQLIDIKQSECDQLFESVSMLWEETGISALPINAKQWRIWLPEPVILHSMTPSCVAENSLSDFWPQDQSLRGWRKLLNEIQMVWHDHPVNLSRQQHGKPPINSIWLFGGATLPNKWSSNEEKNPFKVIDRLSLAHATQDWSEWITQLELLNLEILNLNLPADESLSLIGQNKIITLTPEPLRWWHKLIRPKSKNWRMWWNNPD